MDIEVDVLVAGAGAAGMTAALVCKLRGLDVLLCEKSSQAGGTTATSAGTIWVPNSRLHGLDGTRKLTSPVSTTGLMTITWPPRLRTFISVVISRG